eukprot:scaffold10139_cov80-Attheya_sp.AAC.5
MPCSAKHLELLKLMKVFNYSLAIKLVFNKTVWDSFLKFPLHKNYQKHFTMMEINPPGGTREMVAHCKLHTKQHVNSIKFSNNVWNFDVKEANNIYLVIDHYEMQKLAYVVGYITLIHLHLAWLSTLGDELTTFAMQEQTQLPKSEPKAWKKRTKDIVDDEVDEVSPVPPFHFKSKQYRFRSGKLCIETNLLQTSCTVDDAKYLKTLLSDTFLNGYVERGNFLPYLLHLIADPDTLKGIL